MMPPTLDRVRMLSVLVCRMRLGTGGEGRLQNVDGPLMVDRLEFPTVSHPEIRIARQVVHPPAPLHRLCDCLTVANVREYYLSGRW